MRFNATAVTLLLIMIASSSTYGGISVFAGSAPKDETEGGFRDGPGREALFAFPNAICSDKDGKIYVADSDRVRKIDAKGNVSTIAIVDADPQLKARPHLTGIAIDKFGNIYAVDRMYRRLLLIDAKGALTIIARTEREPHGVAVNDSGDVFLNEYERIFQVSRDGKLAVYAENSQRDETARISDLMGGMAFDEKGNLVIADEYGGVRRINKETKRIEVVPGLEANASGIAIGKDGEIYVSNGLNHLIYRINDRNR